MNAAFLEVPPYGFAGIAAATLLGGVLRGFTGGAGAVVVMPVLSAFAGAFIPRVFRPIPMLAPVFVFGAWAGARIFGRVDEALFRRLSLGATIVVSALVLFL